MAYVDKDLAAYLATLQVGDKVTVSSGSTTYTKVIERMTKTQLVMEGAVNGYQRRFRRDNGLDAEGGTASWRRDCIITPASAQARLAQRQLEAKQRRLRQVIDGLGLDSQNRSKEQVLEALGKARALVLELM